MEQAFNVKIAAPMMRFTDWTQAFELRDYELLYRADGWLVGWLVGWSVSPSVADCKEHATWGNRPCFHRRINWLKADALNPYA